MRAQPNAGTTVTPNTATASGSSYDPPTLKVCARQVAMERFLLLWDELDDIVGTSRYYVKNTAMAIWTSVRPR
jgi:hypothetical protein